MKMFLLGWLAGVLTVPAVAWLAIWWWSEKPVFELPEDGTHG
jgi:4-amino-4-deoxy-L-arabinose transferase-like glycosyltransferase